MEPTPRIPQPLSPVVLALLLGLALAPLLTPSGAAVCGVGPLLLLGVGWKRLRSLSWALALGLLLGLAEDTRRRLPLTLHLPAVHTVSGTVGAVTLSSHGAQRFTLRDVRLAASPSTLRLPDIAVKLRLRGRHAGVPARLAPGMQMRCVMLLVRPRNAYEARQAALRGFVATRHAIELTHDPASLGAGLAGLRVAAAASLARVFSRPDEGLSRALLLGDRGRLDPADRQRFRDSGQAHLLAVSGLHVGLLLAGLLLLVRLVGVPRRATLFVGILAAAFYVCFSGAPPSAVRAGLGASAWMIARLLGRAPVGLTVLTLVGCLVVYGDAGNAGRPAFQLSFAAVLGILLLTERIRGALVPPRPVLPGLLPPVRAPLRTTFSVGLAAWLGTAPFVAHHIGRLCPAGPLISLPALPLTALLLGSGFATLVLAEVPLLANLAGAVFALSAWALRGWLELTRAAGLGALPAARPPIVWWPAYLVAFVIAVRGPRRRTWIGLGLMLALLTLLILAGSAGAAAREYDAAMLLPPQLAILPPAALPGSELLWIALGLGAFAALAVRPLGWLRPGGALGAWFLGTCSALAFGWAGLAALFAPFVVATVLGKLPGAQRAGARSLRQVGSNGLPALAGCVLASAGHPALGLTVFLGALACLGADTCATEIGVRFGGRPFRLAGRGPIQSGESGGVTIAGLCASLVGALLAPAAFALVLRSPPGTALLTIGIFSAAGVIGALIDSLLGGTLQYRGRHAVTGALTEKTRIDGERTVRLSGLRWLDNDAVNLVSGCAAGLAAVGLAGLAGIAF